MKKIISTLLLPILLAQTATWTAFAQQQEAAKSVQQSQKSATPLTNIDVIRMVKAEFAAETIVAMIKSSACDFTTSPEALRHLKEELVPDSVLLAMVMAPRSTESSGQHAAPAARSVKVVVPNGVTLEVEAPFDVSSQLVRKGEKISFRVVNPVKVNGVVVVEAGATATAEVVKAERGGHFGRAGRLAWAMQDVAAVDGTRIPLQSAGRIVGDSKGAKVATQMIIMGAIFWVAAPVALLSGFKRGGNAVLPAGKRFEVLSSGQTTVVAPAPPGQ